jgi:hypothetical protein
MMAALVPLVIIATVVDDFTQAELYCSEDSLVRAL